MAKLLFDVIGSIKIQGRLTTVVDEGKCAVEINGQLATSGWGGAALARAIGIENIKIAVDPDELLSLYSADEIIDHIVNSDRPDDAVLEIAKQLIHSLQNETA